MSNSAVLTGGTAYGAAGFTALILLIIGSIVLLTSRKKSVICRWIITVFFVLGTIACIPNLAVMIEQGMMGVIGSVQMLMQAYAIYLLFNDDSKTWLASKRFADN
jgi:hypothetical protein